MNLEADYELEFKVRDYELDLQGIVNNSVYQNYLEHARHEYLLTQDIDFAALHNEGIDLVVARVEIDYKASLKSQDSFVVKLVMRKEGNVRVVIHQWIERLPDHQRMIEAKTTCVCLKNGRPIRPEIAGWKITENNV
ncbi:MAG: acyl-CoA thioesterase [Bacteroidales bacterium]|jgi:acyl-CoA thioester hydrolase|nr:acyl-CoA thioesterase [Bacteroidales bacterium]